MDPMSGNTSVMNHAIERTIKRLANNPPNDLPNEVYRATVKAGWDGQWLNWDQHGGNGEDDPGWGDIGD